MNKRNKIIYWTSTGLFSAFLLMGATMYFLQYAMVSEMFTKLGFPTFIVYPLATAKILGITAILTKKSKLLKEWAYAGFFFNLVLATLAHINIGDGQFAPPLFALTLLLVSRIYDEKVFGSSLSQEENEITQSGSKQFREANA